MTTPWADVDRAIRKTADTLIVVGFVNEWSPTSSHTSAALQALADECPRGAQIFVVDADAEDTKAWELGIESTPAILFYYNKEKLTVRRPGWEDDDKVCGAASRAQLLDAVRGAVLAAREGDVLLVGF